MKIVLALIAILTVNAQSQLLPAQNATILETPPSITALSKAAVPATSNPLVAKHQTHIGKIHALSEQLGRAIAWQQSTERKRISPLRDLRDDIVRFVSSGKSSSKHTAMQLKSGTPQPNGEKFPLQLSRLEAAINWQAELLRGRIDSEIDALTHQRNELVLKVTTTPFDLLSVKRDVNEVKQPEDLFESIELMMPKIVIRNIESISEGERTQLDAWKREQSELQSLLPGLSAAAITQSQERGHSQFLEEFRAVVENGTSTKESEKMLSADESASPSEN